MTLPEQMAKAAYEKREPGMVWSALSEASREVMVEDMRVGISAIEADGYAVVPMADLRRIADHHPETLGLYHGQNFKLLAQSAAGCAKLMIEAATKG